MSKNVVEVVKNGRPFDKNSLRSQIRAAFLVVGLTATGAEVEAQVRKTKAEAKNAAIVAAEKTMAIQIAQVRSLLLAKIGVKVNRKRGRPNAKAAAGIRKQLNLVHVQGKLTKLKKAA